MEMQQSDTPRTPNPRRKKRTKFQIFKETYLPVIIVAVTVVLLLVFIIGGIAGRDSGAENPSESTPPSGSSPSGSTNATDTTSSSSLENDLEVNNLLEQAAILAKDYDYQGAMKVLENYSGDIAICPALAEAYAQYSQLWDSMVAWQPGQVANLSFHVLIADAERAFNDETYGRSYRQNFITTTEFSAILQQLCDNGYMLVSLSDLYEKVYDESSAQYIYQEKTLYLPEGRIPVMLTETNANYYSYMVDSNNDGVPDGAADGFAYNLCYGANGFYNELVLADGTVVAGAYDLVPILENFIKDNPDFSYRDARAIIAMTGYDGILGYRINSNRLTETQREEARQSASAVVQALRDHGYEIACFTYNNLNYGEKSATEIQTDLQKWADHVASVVGQVDILVLPKESDIGNKEGYAGNVKFNVIYNAGFSIFLGTETTPWSQVSDRYVRHDRLLVTGSYLSKNPEWYTELFDTAAVLDPYRDNFN